MEQYKVLEGNMLEVLPTLEENSFDVCITDPPYELNFMGKGWDNSGVAFQKETWEKVLRVLKPGAYLVAFGGTRTYHRIACAIEDAGFEIRDCMMYLYGSGFPKSLNVGLAVDKLLGCSNRGHRIAVANRYHPDGTLEPNGDNLPKYEARTEEGKKWSGYGTQLKPAYEPIIIARKPPEKTIAENVLKYGCGAINIDAGRIDFGKETDSRVGTDAVNTSKCGSWQKDGNNGTTQMYKSNGRFPANVIHDGSEEVISGFPTSEGSSGKPFKATEYETKETATNFNSGDYNPYNDSGSASRYFYCAKASKKDRDEGLDMFEEKSPMEQTGRKEHSLGLEYIDEKGKLHQNPYAGTKSPKKNIHPTVKPIELMQYLIKLFAPEGANILDCFAGSGSTGKAAMFENRERNTNYTITMVEMTHEYIPIIKARCDYAINKYEYDLKLKEEKTGQMNLFDFTEGD